MKKEQGRGGGINKAEDRKLRNGREQGGVGFFDGDKKEIEQESIAMDIKEEMGGPGKSWVLTGVRGRKNRKVL